MNVCGIVAEFDPFHNGHKYLTDAVRGRLGEDTAIIAVMSGNFVQRGAPACFDKFLRTKAAITGGIDLVIELPVDFALSTAQQFTLGGVKTLCDTRAITHIAFGSECGNIDRLKTAQKMLGELTSDDLHPFLDMGLPFAAARQAAFCRRFGDKFSDILQNPNDILALGYLDALDKLKSNITPLCIKRSGTSHNGGKPNGNIASASYIRSMIFGGGDYGQYLPAGVNQLLCDETNTVSHKNADIAVLSRLRALKAEDFARLSDISEGLESRIYDAVMNACSLDELYDNAKTKRYSHSRIRRIVFNAALGNFECQPPQYLRILGFSKKGAALLSKIKQNGALPPVTSYKDAKALSDTAARQFERCANHTDFYNLLKCNIAPCGEEYRQAVVKI